jgi:hypothetical protein
MHKSLFRVDQNPMELVGHSWYPIIPGWWPPRCMQAQHLPLFVALLKYYSFFAVTMINWYLMLLLHLLHVPIICTSLLLKLNNFYIDLPASTYQNGKVAYHLQVHINIIGVSYYYVAGLISWLLICRSHLMQNGQILAKMVLNQRTKLRIATPMMKRCSRMALGVNTRNLGHQQSGQRTWL